MFYNVWRSAAPLWPPSPPSPVVQKVSTWGPAVSLVKFCKCGCILISLPQGGDSTVKFHLKLVQTGPNLTNKRGWK